MGFLSGGFSSSKNKSKSTSTFGVGKEERQRAAQEGLDFIPNTLLPQVQDFATRVPLLSLTPQGLTQAQSGLAGNLVDSQFRNFFNKFSARNATRGQVSPQNVTGTIGSATQRAVESALPQFLSLAKENEMFNVQSPQNTQAQAIAFLKDIGQLFSLFTQGGEQKSKGSGSSLSVNFAGGAGSGGGGASGGSFIS